MKTYQSSRRARPALEALGDPTRRAVFELLRRGPQPVGSIAARLPVSRPAVSQHLRVLKEAGLVADRREGTKRLYSIDPEGLSAVRAYFEEFWAGVLGEFKEAVETGKRRSR